MSGMKDDHSPFPQPHGVANAYRYVSYNNLEELYFPFGKPLPNDTLCWVLKSKGRLRNAVKCDESGDFDTRAELFLRARVVCDSDGDCNNQNRRVLIRYPKGSTYKVKRCNLLPVLEPSICKENIVLVIPETPQYRRAAAVHTCVGECFLEIGCDYGITVDRVRKCLVEYGDVPRIGSDNDGNHSPTYADRACCLGVDKSRESIDVAIERYPNSTFALHDALTQHGTKELQRCASEKLQNEPSVVAIDINGNRPLPAVLTCLRLLMENEKKLPRLIIVKSRGLHQQLVEQENYRERLGPR